MSDQPVSQNSALATAIAELLTKAWTNAVRLGSPDLYSEVDSQVQAAPEPEDCDTLGDPETPIATEPPLTHQDVVNALRLRIVTECTTSTSSTSDLAALVSAYNGTESVATVDARHKEMARDMVLATLSKQVERLLAQARGGTA